MKSFALGWLSDRIKPESMIGMTRIRSIICIAFSMGFFTGFQKSVAQLTQTLGFDPNIQVIVSVSSQFILLIIILVAMVTIFGNSFSPEVQEHKANQYRESLGYGTEVKENEAKANIKLSRAASNLEQKMNSARRTGVLVSTCSVFTILASLSFASSPTVLVILSVIFLIYGLFLLNNAKLARKLLDSEVES